MRSIHTAERYSFVFYTHFAILLCCLMLLLSACGDSSSSAGSPPVHTPTPGPTAKPSPTSTPSPTQDSQQVNIAKVQKIIDGMSLDQKLGQLIVVEYLGNDYQTSGLQYMITQQFVGGFMYQESNHNFFPPYDVISNVANLTSQINHDAQIPLLVATDQEGGLVNRLYRFHGYLPSAQEMAATGDPHFAFNQGSQAARWLQQLGINADLAPVVDVHTVDPPVLVTRMFGRDPQTVATYAGAFLDGLQQNGVAGTLKHFPGLGAISSDPHAGLPTVNRSMADLESIDLAPYKLLISSKHPAMIMSTDVLMPAIDPTLPAELSPKAINGVLRGELGYDGVVITDGLYMLGISQKWSIGTAAVMSIEAGDDLIEGPFTPGQVASVVSSLKQALQQGQLTMDRINQSLQRILLLKLQYGIIKT